MVIRIFMDYGSHPEVLYHFSFFIFFIHILAHVVTSRHGSFAQVIFVGYCYCIYIVFFTESFVTYGLLYPKQGSISTHGQVL